jgi:hypothetical protein
MTPWGRNRGNGQPAEDGVSILVLSGTDEQAVDERRSSMELLLVIIILILLFGGGFSFYRR